MIRGGKDLDKQFLEVLLGVCSLGITKIAGRVIRDRNDGLTQHTHLLRISHEIEEKRESELPTPVFG